MWYINEEACELVVHFVERNTTVEIESYMSHKYWFKCRNEFELDILTDVIVDKLDRLA